MAVFNMIEEADATGKVKEVFEDIKKKRNTDYINNFWKMLANNPEPQNDFAQTVLKHWSEMGPRGLI